MRKQASIFIGKYRTQSALIWLLISFVLMISVAALGYAQDEGAAEPAGGDAVSDADAGDAAPSNDSGDSAKVEKKEEIVKTGVIASTPSRGQSGAVNVETGGDAPGDEASTISGGISVTGRNRCTAKIMNSSDENSYSVRYKIQGKNERGSRTLNKSYSAVVGPGKTHSRAVRCNENDAMSLRLLSAKKSGG